MDVVLTIYLSSVLATFLTSQVYTKKYESKKKRLGYVNTDDSFKYRILIGTKRSLLFLLLCSVPVLNLSMFSFLKNFEWVSNRAIKDEVENGYIKQHISLEQLESEEIEGKIVDKEIESDVNVIDNENAFGEESIVFSSKPRVKSLQYSESKPKKD